MPPAPPELLERQSDPDLFNLAHLTSAAPPAFDDDESVVRLDVRLPADPPLPRMPAAPSRVEPRRPHVPRSRVPRAVQAIAAVAAGMLAAAATSALRAEASPDPAGVDEPAATEERPAFDTMPPPSVDTSGETSIVAEDDRASEWERDRRRQERRERQLAEAADSEATQPEEESLEETSVETASAPAAPLDTTAATLDQLLDHAVDDEPAPTTTDDRETGAEPAVTGPSREQVRSSMEAVRPALAECAAGRHGLAQVQVTVSPSGRVRAVRVTGAFAGSAEGSCMARAARGAQFAAFEGEPFTAQYPYRF
jgi:hypothetical protein